MDGAQNSDEVNLNTAALAANPGTSCETGGVCALFHLILLSQKALVFRVEQGGGEIHKLLFGPKMLQV